MPRQFYCRGMRIAVVGAGIVGLGCTYELLRRGAEAHCYEVAVPMGARSAGDTRIFRTAHADPDLVQDAHRARRGWTRWSQAAGEDLVGREGTVVSGDIDAMAAAMTAAGAAYQIRDEAPGLPAADPTGPFLLDALGGAIHAAATGRFLLAAIGTALRTAEVTAVDPDGTVTFTASPAPRTAEATPDGTVRTGSTGSRYDAVLIAAGAGTPGLAATAGIQIDAPAEHHARCTYPLRDPAAVPPCWLDRSGAWRPGFTSYGHLAGPGRWAIGGHLPELRTAWGYGHGAVTDWSREVLDSYVREYVTGAVPEAVDVLHCDPIAAAGDGVHTERAGRILAVWGNNLFKLAPHLATSLAGQLNSA